MKIVYMVSLLTLVSGALNVYLIQAATQETKSNKTANVQEATVPSIQEGRETALHQAALKGDEELVKKLALSISVNAKDDEGDTPLHYAAVEGHLEAVKALIGAGADPSLKNDLGHTPLDYVTYDSLDERSTDVYKKQRHVIDYLKGLEK